MLVRILLIKLGDRLLAILALLCLSELTSGQVTQDALHSSGEKRACTFSIDRKGEHFIIPVTVKGTSGSFVLDSGASCHVLDDRYKSQLGKPIAVKRGRTAGAPITVELFESPYFDVGHLSTKSDVPVALLDLKQISEAAGQDIHGIIGAPVFLNHTVSLDFDHGVLHIYDAERQSIAHEGKAIPLRKSKGVLYIEDVEIGDEISQFLLDTGSNASITLTKGRFEQLTREGFIKSIRTTKSITGSGEVERRSGKLEEIQIGPFVHRSLIVDESTSNKIGLGYLHRFHATIDASNSKLYLAKGLAYDAPDRGDASGVHLLWNSNQVIIDSVDGSSPAKLASILAGDVLLEMNGRRATGSNLNQLRRTLRGEPGKRVQIKLLRNGQEHSVQFYLADYSKWGLAAASAPQTSIHQTALE